MCRRVCVPVCSNVLFHVCFCVSFLCVWERLCVCLCVYVYVRVHESVCSWFLRVFVWCVCKIVCSVACLLVCLSVCLSCCLSFSLSLSLSVSRPLSVSVSLCLCRSRFVAFCVFVSLLARVCVCVVCIVLVYGVYGGLACVWRACIVCLQCAECAWCMWCGNGVYMYLRMQSLQRVRMPSCTQRIVKVARADHNMTDSYHICASMCVMVKHLLLIEGLCHSGWATSLLSRTAIYSFIPWLRSVWRDTRCRRSTATSQHCGPAPRRYRLPCLCRFVLCPLLMMPPFWTVRPRLWSWCTVSKSDHSDWNASLVVNHRTRVFRMRGCYRGYVARFKPPSAQLVVVFLPDQKPPWRWEGHNDYQTRIFILRTISGNVCNVTNVSFGMFVFGKLFLCTVDGARTYLRPEHICG